MVAYNPRSSSVCPSRFPLRRCVAYSVRDRRVEPSLPWWRVITTSVCGWLVEPHNITNYRSALNMPPLSDGADSAAASERARACTSRGITQTPGSRRICGPRGSPGALGRQRARDCRLSKLRCTRMPWHGAVPFVPKPWCTWHRALVAQ